MSELKAFRIIQGDTGGYGAPSYKCSAGGIRIEEWSDACEVYDRYEADKVITELKSKLDIYKRGFAEDDKIIAYLYAELRHQKYKRCLDKAKACHEKSERMYCEASTAKSLNEIIGNEPKDAVVEKFELLGAIASTHRKRWLELAEKFKEAK